MPDQPTVEIDDVSPEWPSSGCPETATTATCAAR